MQQNSGGGGIVATLEIGETMTAVRVRPECHQQICSWPDCEAHPVRPIKCGRLTKQEADPNGKNPHEPGAKLDAGKAPIMRGLLDYFPRACMAVAEVSAFGASKYAWKGWETVPDGVQRYSDAEMRHACKESIEGPKDADSGLMHKAHRAWNALAALELALREQEGK